MPLCLLLICVLLDPLDHELEYVAALRSESFYRLSQAQAERLLAQQDLTAEQRSQIVVELSKTFAAQALNSRPPERETFWKQATEVLDQELQTRPGPSVKILMQSQLAFIREQQAEWSVREGEIRSRTEADWQVARNQLRAAIKSLRQVQQDLQSPVMRQHRDFSGARLLEVKRNVQFQLANAFQHQAIAYRDSSRDRSNALTQAMELYQALATGREQDALVWKSRIGRARCVRMLGQFAQAQKLLKQLSSVPEKYIGAVAAEGIRLALDARNLEAAMQLAANDRIDANAPEFQLARIEAFVTAAEQLKGQPKAKTLQQQSADIAAALAEKHGVYWSLRGEILLSRLAFDQNADTSLLSNAAETMLRQDSPETAKEMFQRAAEQASQQGQPGDRKAFEFLYKAAVVDHREKRLQPAIEQFRSVALKYPTHSQAAEAHLLAVFDAAALYQEYAAAQAPTLEQALSQYESLLAEHLDTWPDSTTADQARIWSAKLAMAKRQWTAAVNLYQAIPTGSKFEVASYQGLDLAYAKWFSLPTTTPLEIQKQRNWMQARLDTQPPLDARTQLAITAATSAMSYPPRDYAFASSVLQAVRADQKATRAGITHATQVWGVLSMLAAAGSGQSNRAGTLLSQLGPLPADSLLMLIRGLQPIRAERRGDPALRNLTNEVLGLLKPHQNQVRDEDKLLIEMAIADYLPNEQSVTKYEQFAKVHPHDKAIQRRYAELLSSVDRRETRQLAVQQWRHVVRLSDKQSTEWFRAKLGVAEAHYKLNEPEKAKQLVEYMIALYPELGGSELKRQFEDLLRRCGG